MSRGTKRFCVNGHDTWMTGRYPSGTCIPCNKRYGAEYLTRKHGGVAAWRLREVMRQGRWSDEALVTAYQAYAGVTYEGAKKALTRLMRSGRVDLDTADRWCLAIGTHLSTVYPELYGLAGVSA